MTERPRISFLIGLVVASAALGAARDPQKELNSIRTEMAQTSSYVADYAIRAEKLAEAAGDQAEIVAKALQLAAQAYFRLRDYRRAIDAYRRALAKTEDDESLKASALEAIGQAHLKLEEYGRAIACFRQVLKEHSPEPEQKRKLLKAIASAHQAQGDYDEAIARHETILREFAGQAACEAEALHAIAEIRSLEGRPKKQIATYKRALRTLEKDPAASIATLQKMARAHRTRRDYEAAVSAYRQIIVTYPPRREDCLKAQEQITLCHLLQGDYARALAAAVRYFHAAPMAESQLLRGVSLICRCLKALDGNLARANAYRQFQRSGPAGLDGRAGTQDDLADPLAAFEPPFDPEHDTEFRQATASAKSLREKGYLRLYWGKPKEALQALKQAYLTCRAVDRLDGAANDVVVGLKAAQGHALGLDRFYLYQQYGPKGKDGQAGTADDLTDPLADF